MIGCCGSLKYFVLYISFIIYTWAYLYFYEIVFIRKAFSMQAGGVAGAFEYSCVVYAGGRFQLLLLTTCIHLSLILLLYYYILLLVPLLPLQPLLLFILIVVLTTRFICVESAQNCFMNGMRFLC